MEIIIAILFTAAVVLSRYQLKSDILVEALTERDAHKVLSQLNEKENARYSTKLWSNRNQSPTPIEPEPIPPQEKPPEIIPPEQNPPIDIPPEEIPPERIAKGVV